MSNEIFLATVLLEKNRWGSGKKSSLQVSELMPRIAEAGFDGIELWENHLLHADTAEREAVKAGPVPITIFNTYCLFDDESSEKRAASAEMARFLNAPAVKFNFGKNPDERKTYCDNLLRWHDELPEGCQLLCECHPGTILEDPTEAAEILKPLSVDVKVIVHAMNDFGDSGVQPWLDVFGNGVAHVHVQPRNPDGNGFAALKDLAHARDRVRLLKESGFEGTWSIEFCKGVSASDESVDLLLDAAIEDRAVLKTMIEECAG